jgi:histidyl-tRNA synthetase
MILSAELIMLCQRLWDDLGLQNVRLKLNSIGDANERPVLTLISYFENHSVLRCGSGVAYIAIHCGYLIQNPAMQEMVNAAPKLLDYLGAESLAHFDGVQKCAQQYSVHD